MTSKVYYMNARSASLETGLVPKLLAVFDAAGFDELVKPKDVVAIKTHCGEWNNTGYLRPVYARALADRVKSLGGRPFVCDTTTLPYNTYASRVTELDFLTTAERNGYSPAVLGCPFICADGFMGTDDYRVDLPEGYILKEAFVATAIAAADVLITLTHFKGHAMGVIGGAIKNLGIGAQSKRGKFNVHMGGHPRYGFTAAARLHPEKFLGRNGQAGWKLLEDSCPYGLIHATEESIEWDQDQCPTCRACMVLMTSSGILEVDNANQEAANAAIADACLGTIKAVGKGKVAFINLALDLSPGCDCVNFSDMPIVPNLGVFASYDPVAIDKACIDQATAATGIPGSTAAEKGALHAGGRKFEVCSSRAPGVSEEIQLATGEIIGLGTRQYELIQVAEGKPEDFAFAPDPRPVGVRFRGKFAKIPPFPRDRHDGKGFLRVDDVDLDRVNAAAPTKTG
jgi:uncharacterized Fe-S center protein